MVTARDVRDLLDDRPDLEPAVEEILDAEEPFTFDTLDIDSGPFGELVSRGVVERTDEEAYHVPDREAIRRGLSRETDDTATNEPILRNLSLSTDVDRLTLGLVFAAFGLLVVFRLVSFQSVFRDGHIVLVSNDPYYYRYLVEQLVSSPDSTLSNLGFGVEQGEPLFVVVLWFIAELLGGAPTAIGQVLAWAPVLAAVITAALLYAITMRATDDRRIAITTVAMLAVLPTHVIRTSLGFGDHHAFDYIWVAVTLLGVVLTAAVARRSERDPVSIAAAVCTVAVGVTGQILAWEAGPLLVVPLGLYLAADGLRAIARDESPLPTSGPVLLGIGIAAVLTLLVHLGLGWQTIFVTSTPALLAVAGIGVIGVTEGARRLGVSAIAVAAVEGIGAGVGVYALATLWPGYWAQLTTSVTGRLLASRAIAETQSLFGASLNWLLLFGALLVLAVPYMAWGVQRSRDDVRWLPLSVYGWYFLVLAVIQIRFAGQLALFVAIFAGVGFVHVAAWIDAARPLASPATGDTTLSPQLPDRGTIRSVVLLFLFVTSLSVVLAPVKVNQSTVDEAKFEAATEMAEYSAERDLQYPANYVFSQWGWNRMYNYFVNGNSRSYGFARRNYEDFVRSTNPDPWYDQLQNRGFVVTTDDVRANASELGTRLHDAHGSRTDAAPALVHYRLIDSSGDGSVKAFAIVPGAIVRGTAAPNTTVTLTTEVTVDGNAFTYTRRTRVNATGQFTARVPYPGTYSYGESTIRVPESAVQNGTTVTAEQR